MEDRLDPAIEEAYEEFHLSYIKRWHDNGARGIPLTRAVVVKMISDYPTQDAAGKLAINQLLEVCE